MNYYWDYRLLELAEHISRWSKDPSTQVGAVIARPDKTIASVGYNGFPRGIADDGRLDDREQKLERIIHGEINALISAPEPVDGYTLYTYPFQPCGRCAPQLIQAGISRVVSYKTDNTKWADSFKVAQELFSEAGVQLDLLEDIPF